LSTAPRVLFLNEKEGRKPQSYRHNGRALETSARASIRLGSVRSDKRNEFHAPRDFLHVLLSTLLHPRGIFYLRERERAICTKSLKIADRTASARDKSGISRFRTTKSTKTDGYQASRRIEASRGSKGLKNKTSAEDITSTETENNVKPVS